MAISFVAWSAIYAMFTDKGTASRMGMFLRGHHHMWFILMITGLYICIPFIKPIVENNNKIKYYLVLAFCFAFAFPSLVTLTNDFASDLMIKGISAINKDINSMNMHIVLGYVGYFVLGYYLNKINLNTRQRIVVYFLGTIGFILTILLELIVTFKTQQYCGHYYDNFSVNVLLESIAVFIWFKYRKYTHARLYPFVRRLSKYSFGAYLIHVLVINQLNICCGINTLMFNPILAVVGIGIIVFLISFVISGILNQVPIIKKYMV